VAQTAGWRRIAFVASKADGLESVREDGQPEEKDDKNGFRSRLTVLLLILFRMPPPFFDVTNREGEKASTP
jgi:hypothetical protein